MKPVAYVDNRCNDSIEWLVDPLKLDEGTPLYTAPRELSDDEIADLLEEVNEETGRCSVRIFDHAKVLLRKLKEKYERESKEDN